jgi:hypothetical protein
MKVLKGGQLFDESSKNCCNFFESSSNEFVFNSVSANAHILYILQPIGTFKKDWYFFEN